MIYEKLSFSINSKYADEANSILEGIGMGPCFSVKLVDVNNVEYLGGYAQGNGIAALALKIGDFSKKNPVFENMVFAEIDFDEFLNKTGLKLVKIPLKFDGGSV